MFYANYTFYGWSPRTKDAYALDLRRVAKQLLSLGRDIVAGIPRMDYKTRDRGAERFEGLTIGLPSQWSCPEGHEFETYRAAKAPALGPVVAAYTALGLRLGVVHEVDRPGWYSVELAVMLDEESG